MPKISPTLTAVAGLSLALLATPAAAQDVPGYPFDGMVQIETEYDFDTLGIEIPASGLIGTFRNDYAVRILTESVPAGFEQPIRFYLTANDAGTTDLTYRLPSALYAPYGDPDVDAIATELDVMFQSIAAQATGNDG